MEINGKILDNSYPIIEYSMSKDDYINSMVKLMYEQGYEERENKVIIFDSNGLEMFEITNIDKDLVLKRFNELWNTFNPKNKV